MWACHRKLGNLSNIANKRCKALQSGTCITIGLTSLRFVQAFCWLCGHATGYTHTWTEIAQHSCGRYKEEADKKIDQAQRNNKRYQHYCLRWWVPLSPINQNRMSPALGAGRPMLCSCVPSQHNAAQ